jgi:threonylcarbamoyladenosine tRNA methylthiotransferase MtaB
MHVFLTTLGCRLNEAELESWSRGFRSAGDHVVASPGHAQVVVVNTCAVTAEAARKSRKFVNGLHRQNPSARLVVTGCFAELEPDRARELTGVDLVVGNHDKENLVDIVRDQLDVPVMPVLATEPAGSHVYEASGRTRAFIKVQDGCRNRCSFCIVTIARGEERSRTIDDIVCEIQALYGAGYREAVLTGVHLGGYGSDLGTDLFSLMTAVLADTDMPRIRLSSLEPWDLPDGFWSLWNNPRLMPHLHLPLQSGSDSVLRRMHRRCDTASYRGLVEASREFIPDLTITTDIIVGFPGETDAEWAETVDYVEGMGFGHMHIFTYSARAGTKAATLPGQLPNAVKKDRSRQLHAIAEGSKRRHIEAFSGSCRDVLWETNGGNGTERMWMGYTDNYVRVEAPITEGENLQNRITAARLGAATARGTLSATPMGE